MLSRLTWEREVMDYIIELLEVTNSDAQGLFDAHPFEAAQEWGKGSLPQAAAKRIIKSSECI